MRKPYLLFIAVLAAACGGAGARPTAPAPQPGGVFADSVYASALPPRTAASAHAAKGLPVPSVKTPCLGCHAAGGTGPAFSIAGTIYADEPMTKGAADVEVRVVDATGKGVSAHSDSDGNFWAPGPPLALPAHAAARAARKTLAMGSTVDKADCNGCHDAAFPMLLKPVQ